MCVGVRYLHLDFSIDSSYIHFIYVLLQQLLWKQTGGDMLQKGAILGPSLLQHPNVCLFRHAIFQTYFLTQQEFCAEAMLNTEDLCKAARLL